ncbi:sensor histidine kinase response [Grosmannia clavigera kw1407]|uniref:histidine kinase n=1 Tax=Grosmannia clavigera (strain kw1407 / UAMH 11150) TaxID=655863 RepID=F0XTJ2_GROCL|nr:sensor histidine kinase response [Grosmannia clavigera kw1407]EFW99038.1 sensor histidine kinase response [Grosmannia clavigera kw1407]
MDFDASLSPDDSLDPPVRLFERLHQIAGYSWDETPKPYHSSYDNWHVFGTRFISPFSTSSGLPTGLRHASTWSPVARASSSRASPAEPPVFSPSAGEWVGDHTGNASPSANSATPDLANSPVVEEAVVARVSYHVLREERAFHIVTSMISSGDPHGEHIAKPIDYLRLNHLPGDRGPLIVAIYQFPGTNDLPRYIDLGPAFYYAHRKGDVWEASTKSRYELEPPISLDHFLDFAIGAAQCLELIHHNQNIVHGEIRGDAFHFNQETGRTKLVSFGSGVRSFEHGLTSTGWSSLSRERGAKNKLLYISPEQTGRMPAEPDSRTDIYSLGVLYWVMLTQRPVYEGDTPMDIVQGVLGRRVPNVSAVRIDIPDVIGRIIQKCTAKSISDRYHSASGLRQDLVKVKECLASGDLATLKDWQVASRDVSSFFLLPNLMIGRDAQRKALFKVIERVAKSHAMDQKGKGNRFSDSSSFSNDFVDIVDGSSDGGASSGDGPNYRSGSFTQTAPTDVKFRGSLLSATQSTDNLTVSGDMSSIHSNGPPLRLPQRSWEWHSSVSFDLRSPLEGSMTERESSRHAGSIVAETTSSLSRQLGSAKFRRRGHCEIIIVEGAVGVGKSCLIQSVMTEARRRGYCATAKFDKARKAAFGPLLHLLSSLFRQVWGERNTDTPFHQALKQYVRPVWPTLHLLLGLPDFLFNSADGAPVLLRSPCSQQFGAPPSKGTRPADLKRVSSPGPSSSSSSMGPNKGNSAGGNPSRMSGSSSQEFLRAGTSTKSIRLMNTILDVLRMFTSHKFICFVLDDLHFADAESLEMITQIISARLHMVLIISCRPDGTARSNIQSILSPLELDRDAPKGSQTVTRVELGPLAEQDIVKYVALTLSRSEQEVMPLSLVLQAKTAGNPFYMREMLSACYRRKCIWYDYRESQWAYDMNRVFEQFQGDRHYDILDTDFITNRLKELPAATRSILGWAALLGNAFSFGMICHLLSGEFNYIDETCPEPLSTHVHTAYSQQDAVAGLQVAIQACVIVQSETDDRFRFAHDRYIQASMDMKVCSAKKMHFVIAQMLLRYYNDDVDTRDSTASHICEAMEVIKARVHRRQAYRKLLCDCGRSATENGARSTAAKYYSNAVSLLQPDGWRDDGDDVSYEETIQLYLRAAECYLYMNQYALANEILTTILANARSAFDKAPAWVLQSRIFAQSGNPIKALSSLRECLQAMDVRVRDEPTYEQCDAEFEKLSVRIQGMGRSEVLNPPTTNDAATVSVGAVLAEALSTSLWTDNLYIYHVAQAMVNMHLTLGPFPQSGLGFLYLAIMAITRFGMIRFASDLGDYALELLDRFRDPYCMARGYILYAGFVGHVHYPLALTVTQLEGSLEYGAASADRMSAILNFGVAAMIKFFASENLSDLEGFCEYCCEDIASWHLDTQGGTLLVAVRQCSRALQGKTHTQEALDVMSDEQHDAAAYKKWLAAHSCNGERSLVFYESMELVPLYLYGHYDRALELGQRCLGRGRLMLSARNTRLVMLFYGLALAGLVLRRQQDPRRRRDGDGVVEEQDRTEDTILKLQELRKGIQDWSDVSDINYLAWSTLLDAQISELSNDVGRALRQYEEALDHSSEHSFIFEEALGNYLMAGVFIRRAARRSARAALRDAVGLYLQVGASGVVGRIEEEHSFLLRSPLKNPRTVDAAVQTDFATDHTSVHYDGIGGGGEMDQQTNSDILETGRPSHLSGIRGERIGVWRGAMQAEAETGIGGLPALDMIDLHAILQSSQVISSVLRVDELLKTMCDVILQTCGGSATQAAIIVQDEDEAEWCVAASGDPERKAVAHMPGIPLTGTRIVAENVVLYSLRFRESVFVADLISDERFGNVSEQWLQQKKQQSRSVISIPICHASNPLMGVLYLEGVQGAFTDRNVTVLQLLVNQIGISYSNALSMKATEKVSAENRSMVVLQKTALRKAIEAENKAKEAENKAKQNLQLAEAAEAEAKRNVKVAEEATKAKSIFLANVSHELRTPLNGVIGNSELLRDSSLTAEQQEMAEAIRLSADLLLIVINDILDFSRMEADKMKLYITAFNPRELMPEVVRAASYRNQEKTREGAVAIEKQIRLPPSLFVYGDPVRLHQVLGNLIGNSIKFTERGTITVGARVESETAATVTLTFWVEDTGIGIQPDQLANLFQPFSQADPSTARKYGGSGLGLSICKSLIELIMKGRIYLESTQHVGTKVWFTVTFDKATEKGLLGGVSPATVAASSPGGGGSGREGGDGREGREGREKRGATDPTDPTEPTETHTAHTTPYMDLSGIDQDQLRVCIAEDNPINRKIAIQYVQRLGYQTVDAYENGQMAVEALRQKALEGRPYHVLLMDVQMPVLDGYEATKLLRRDPLRAVREVLVIAMTASAIQGDREKCLAAGMNDYLAKPVKSDVLRRKLDVYIGVRHPDKPRDSENIDPQPTDDANSTETTPTKKLFKILQSKSRLSNEAVPDRPKSSPSVLQKKNPLLRPDQGPEGTDGNGSSGSGESSAANRPAGRQRSLSIASMISSRSKGQKGGDTGGEEGEYKRGRV